MEYLTKIMDISIFYTTVVFHPFSFQRNLKIEFYKKINWTDHKLYIDEMVAKLCSVRCACVCVCMYV